MMALCIVAAVAPGGIVVKMVVRVGIPPGTPTFPFQVAPPPGARSAGKGLAASANDAENPISSDRNLETRGQYPRPVEIRYLFKESKLIVMYSESGA